MSKPKDQDGKDELQEKIEQLQKMEEGRRNADMSVSLQGGPEGKDDVDGFSEFDVLKTAKIEAEERAMRALAELQNAKRRMEEEKKSFAAFANQSLILELLGIVQSFNLSVSHLPEVLKGDEWVKGVLLIDQQLNALLERRGVKVIECKVGDKVDPSRHEVVMQGEGGVGMVVGVLEKGYEMNGRILRAVKVMVGKGD